MHKRGDKMGIIARILTKTVQTDELKPGIRSAENIAGTTIKAGKRLTENNINTLHDRRIWKIEVYRI
jgi:hypothetical protein